LVLVWGALLGLLAVTVAASFVLTGPLSLAAGLAIATAKSGLIFWFYMHLREEDGLARLFATGALAWLLLLFLLAAGDVVLRQFPF
jgi:cytochrome c oxidase subunit 4